MIIIAIITILILFIITFLIIGNYLFHLALDPKFSKNMIFKYDKKTLEQMEEMRKNNEDRKKWIEKNSSDVWINSKDGVKLHGYEIENQEKSHTWVIIIHGYTGAAYEMVDAIQKYLEMGYNVLAIELKCHGKSEGKYIGMGWTDRHDVIEWINYIIKKDIDSKIIMFGVSMGAATVMMTIGEKLPSNVKIAIEDCGYTSVWDEFKDKLRSYFHLPAFPALYIADIIAKIRAGYGLKEASSINQLKKANIPILFIHGDEDKFVPFKMLDQLYQVAGNKKEKLVIQGAKHAESAKVDPETYWKTIKKFIYQYI